MDNTKYDYSVDFLIKSAFEKELQNNLLLLPTECVDEETLIIIKYLNSRINEISTKYNEKK